MNDDAVPTLSVAVFDCNCGLHLKYPRDYLEGNGLVTATVVELVAGAAVCRGYLLAENAASLAPAGPRQVHYGRDGMLPPLSYAIRQGRLF